MMAQKAETTENTQLTVLGVKGHTQKYYPRVGKLLLNKRARTLRGEPLKAIWQ